MPFRVFALEVGEKTATLTHHAEQTAPGVKIFLVRLQVLRELVDPLGKNGYLNLGRPRVRFVRLVP